MYERRSLNCSGLLQDRIAEEAAEEVQAQKDSAIEAAQQQVAFHSTFTALIHRVIEHVEAKQLFV